MGQKMNVQGIPNPSESSGGCRVLWVRAQWVGFLNKFAPAVPEALQILYLIRVSVPQCVGYFWPLCSSKPDVTVLPAFRDVLAGVQAMLEHWRNEAPGIPCPENWGRI